MTGLFIETLESVLVNYNDRMPGVYVPKRTGRRSNRYKRYFLAKTAPKYGIGLIGFLMDTQGEWGSKPQVKKSNNAILKTKCFDGQLTIKYQSRKPI